MAGILQDRMTRAIDDHLELMVMLDEVDQRNGSYWCHLLTELGDVELALAPTRRFAPFGSARLCAGVP